MKKIKIEKEKLDQDVMFSEVMTLAVSDPADIKAQVEALQGQEEFKTRYVAVAVIDEKALVRVFNYQDMPFGEVKQHILSEAADLLSLSPREIELDFQTTLNEKGRIEGIFICAPKKFVRSCLFELDKIKKIPVVMTDSLLLRLENFLKQISKKEGSFCILDFCHSGVLYLAAFYHQRLRFLRKVPYETAAEAEHAIIQFLMSVCAQSEVKEFDAIYFAGEPPEKEALAAAVQHKFKNALVHHEALQEHRGGMFYLNPVFRLNLLKEYSFSLRARMIVSVLSYLLIYILIVIGAFWAIELRSKDIMIKNLKMYVNEKGYEHALQLKARLK